MPSRREFFSRSAPLLLHPSPKTLRPAASSLSPGRSLSPSLSRSRSTSPSLSHAIARSRKQQSSPAASRSRPRQPSRPESPTRPSDEQLLSYKPEEVKRTTQAVLVESKRKDRLKRVNSYRIEEHIGSGSFGQVYRASKGGEVYAVKVLQRKRGPLTRTAIGGPPGNTGSMLQRPQLRPPAAGGSEPLPRGLDGGRSTQVSELEREIAVMQRLYHPNITRLFEVIDDQMANQVFFVMELVDGTNLAEPIYKKRQVPEEDLRHWLREIILGLEHMHLHEVAHRDVKPDNVLWDPVSRHAKLTDFGTALLLREDHGRLGADFVRPRGGTLAFYAPEMCITDANHRSGGFSAHAADWWAFGVCLYMWLHHVCPFEAPTPVLCMERIRAGISQFPTESQGCPGVSTSALDLVKGLLDPHPACRLTPSAIRHHAFVTADGQMPIAEARRARNAPDERKDLAVYEFRRSVRKVAAELMVVRPPHQSPPPPPVMQSLWQRAGDMVRMSWRASGAWRSIHRSVEDSQQPDKRQEKGDRAGANASTDQSVRTKLEPFVDLDSSPWEPTTYGDGPHRQWADGMIVSSEGNLLSDRETTAGPRLSKPGSLTRCARLRSDAGPTRAYLQVDGPAGGVAAHWRCVDDCALAEWLKMRTRRTMSLLGRCLLAGLPVGSG